MRLLASLALLVVAHFHLQDGPLTWKSWGVEAVFASVSLTRGTETTSPTAYTFLKGDRIADGGRR
ncbi:MAG TPA: hypothetical protein VF316_18880 [Polyangiaceae bacterium]